MENSAFDTARVRAHFPMLRPRGEAAPLAYLDSASSSLTPQPVLDAMDEYYRDYRANVHRGLYRASELATERYEASRKDVARFINAAEDEIIFTRGATEGLNMVARGLGDTFGPGDEVVLTVMEHHANLVPWQESAKRRGFSLRFIPMGEDFGIDLAAAKALIGPATKAVAVIWGSNVLGTVNPAEKIVALARRQAPGAAVILDAAQMAGHRAIDVRSLDCDFLAFSAHKMYGPTGAGALYGKAERLAALAPTMFGGDMISEVTLEGATWNDAPWKFEAGTPNIAGAIGLGAAVRLLESVGIEAAASHEAELLARARAALANIPGVTLYGPQSGDRLGVLSFAVSGIHPHDVATVLDSQGVAVRAGFHCAMPLIGKLGASGGTCRLSLGMYSTKEDIDRLAAGILRAQAVFQK